MIYPAAAIPSRLSSSRCHLVDGVAPRACARVGTSAMESQWTCECGRTSCVRASWDLNLCAIAHIFDVAPRACARVGTQIDEIGRFLETLSHLVRARELGRRTGSRHRSQPGRTSCVRASWDTADLDRFATDAEKAAAVRLDELDREREGGQPSCSVNARNGSAPTVIDEPPNRERERVSRTGGQTQDATIRPQARTQNRGLFQRIPTGNRGNRAFSRRRAELVDALGGGP